jgi:hypothetical protein
LVGSGLLARRDAQIERHSLLALAVSNHGRSPPGGSLSSVGRQCTDLPCSANSSFRNDAGVPLRVPYLLGFRRRIARGFSEHPCRVASRSNASAITVLQRRRRDAQRARVAARLRMSTRFTVHGGHATGGGDLAPAALVESVTTTPGQPASHGRSTRSRAAGRLDGPPQAPVILA